MRAHFVRLARLRNRLYGLPEDFAVHGTEDGYWTACAHPPVPARRRLHGAAPGHVLAHRRRRDRSARYVQVFLVMSQKGEDFHDGGAFLELDGTRLYYEDDCAIGDVHGLRRPRRARRRRHRPARAARHARPSRAGWSRSRASTATSRRASGDYGALASGRDDAFGGAVRMTGRRGASPSTAPSSSGRSSPTSREAVRDGRLANKGALHPPCAEWIEETFGAAQVILTHSCTAALEIAALLCDLEPEDEVIMPAFAYVSTANAFRLRGARLRFVDIRPDTLNLDEALVAAAVEPAHEGDRARCTTRASAPRWTRSCGDRGAPRPRSWSRTPPRRVGATYQGAPPRHPRPPRRLQLPRDQELHRRPGRRPRGERPALRSSAPTSSPRRVPTASASSAARSTGTRGPTSGRPTSPRS